MKLHVLENTRERSCVIDIDARRLVDDVKYYADRSFGDSECYTDRSVCVVYRGSILNEKRPLSYYGIGPEDSVWIGRIDGLLERNRIILTIFVAGTDCELHHFIVKSHSTVSDVISMMLRIFPGLKHSHLWQTDGEALSLDETVTAIKSEKGGHKILFNEVGAPNLTFVECCKLHDRYLIEQPFWKNKWEFLVYMIAEGDSLVVQVKTITKVVVKLMRQFKGYFQSVLLTDRRLNWDLSDTPKAFIQSSFLFSTSTSDRIFDICGYYLRLPTEDYYWDLFDDLVDVFHSALCMSVREFLIHKLSRSTNIDGSIRHIILRAIMYVDESITQSDNWFKMFYDQFLLLPLDRLDTDFLTSRYRLIKIRINQVLYSTHIPRQINNVRQMKKEIYKKTGFPISDLYFIQPGGDQKLEDEDNLESNEFKEYLMEVVSGMNNIKVLQTVDRGGCSEILLCQDIISRMTFVLKKCLTNRFDSYRDISILSLLGYSENFVKFTGLYNYKNCICPRMEYLPGGSLKSRLQKIKRFSERETARICHQILTQVDELHQKNVIHRDIKPANIVFDDQNNVKLIDFGMSKCVDGLSEEELRETLMESSPGMSYYIAPEAVMGGVYSTKIDIWSLGVIVIEMVSGENPLCKMNLGQVLIHISNKKMICNKLPDSFSHELKDFINLCLKPDPKERASTAQLLLSIFIQSYVKSQNK